MQESSASFSIKKWSFADRPREKLRSKGRSYLTNAELLAILIGSGNRSESAVQLSQKILQAANNDLSELSRCSVDQLMHFNGIGEAKAVTIVAAMELGRRKTASAAHPRASVKNSQQAYELLQSSMADLPHEEFWVVYLNNANRVLQREQLSKGGINGTIVDIRLGLKKALVLGAVSLILAHNHPSGMLKPSEADKDITRKFTKAANSLDIKVLDHLIIAGDSYFSFADNSLL